jgi:hypothetical protein
VVKLSRVLLIAGLVVGALAVGLVVASANKAPALDCTEDDVVAETENVIADTGGYRTEAEAVVAFSDDVASGYPAEIATAEEVNNAILDATRGEVRAGDGTWLVMIDDRFRVAIATSQLEDGTFAVSGAVQC